MPTIRRILVALKETARRNSPAVEKAAALARAFGAEIELFHAIETPLFADIDIGNEGLDEQRRLISGQARHRLETLTASLSELGIQVSSRVIWDFPSYEAIIRRARRFGADLVIVERHEGRHRAPALLRLTDWELLRLCPVPVLLVKSPEPYSRPPILAAVDPQHRHAKPARLDDEILAFATLFGKKLRGSLHVVHAFRGMPLVVPTEQYLDPDFVARVQANARDSARESLDRALRKFSVPAGRRHLVDASPLDAIPEIVRETRSAIVVMGAVSRSGLKSLFVGNTAERLIDRLNCDLLVVKPTRFRTRVAAKRRGERIIAPAAIHP